MELCWRDFDMNSMKSKEEREFGNVKFDFSAICILYFSHYTNWLHKINVVYSQGDNKFSSLARVKIWQFPQSHFHCTQNEITNYLEISLCEFFSPSTVNGEAPVNSS